MLKWEIHITEWNTDLHLIKEMSEENGYSYETALTYSEACAEQMRGITNIWIFCVRVADNKIVCKEHYYRAA